MCCKHLSEVFNSCSCWTWVCDVDFGILWRFIDRKKEILPRWKWAIEASVYCVPHFSRWICHSIKRLRGRLWSYKLAYKASTYISLSLQADTRPPNPLPEVLLNFGNALVALMWQLKNALGIRMRLFLRTWPCFRQSSSFKTWRDFVAFSQLPVSRHSLITLRVGSDSEARSNSWMEIAGRRESSIRELM